MRALIMAAGLGTRLRPLTENTPKPLVPVNGRPMVEYLLEILAKGGITEAIINIHYLPEKMTSFVNAWNKKGGVPRLRIQDESAEILGSGGAVALAAPWLFEKERCALVCNSDVLAAPDIAALKMHHQKLSGQGVECTLATVSHPEAGLKYTGIRRQGDLITAFERPVRADPELWMFPGFYVIEVSALKYCHAAAKSFSIMEALWRPLVSQDKLGAWTYLGNYFDLGTVKDVREAEAALKKNALI